MRKLLPLATNKIIVLNQVIGFRLWIQKRDELSDWYGAAQIIYGLFLGW